MVVMSLCAAGAQRSPSLGVLSLHAPPWAGFAVTVELVGFGNSC